MISYDNSISKNKSLALKFIAVSLMIIYHTFGFPDRIENVKYISIMNIAGYNIEYFLGRSGGICVGIFTFLSGYGIFSSMKYDIKYKNIFKRIFNLFLNYWIVFLIFVPIGFYLEKYKFAFSEFILNFIGLINSYNGEWWYLRFYVFILMLYPAIIKIVKKYNNYFIVFISFLINIIGFGAIKITVRLGTTSIFLNIVTLILSWQFLFILGIIVAKERVYAKIANKLKLGLWKYYVLLILVSCLLIVIVDIPVVGEVAKLFLIPILIFILVNIIPDGGIMSELGKHSTNMWLTHSFFCYYFFQKLTFSFKYSIIILLQIYIMTIIVSILINRIINGVKNFNKKLSENFNL